MKEKALYKTTIRFYRDCLRIIFGEPINIIGWTDSLPEKISMKYRDWAICFAIFVVLLWVVLAILWMGYTDLKDQVPALKQKVATLQLELEEAQGSFKSSQDQALREAEKSNKEYDRMQAIVNFLQGVSPVFSADGRQLTSEEARLELASLIYSVGSRVVLLGEIPESVFGPTQDGSFLLMRGIVDGVPAVYSIRMK